MGAEFDYRIYEDDGRAQVADKFAMDCQEERYLNGHGGYSGTIAEMYGIKQFVDLEGDYQSAYDYLDEHHQKWDDAMAVSFIGSHKKAKDDQKYWIVGGWCSS